MTRDSIELDFYDDELFGNEAGEDEDPAVLSSYFITKDKFNKFFSQSRRFAIVRARKGMGKSSLLSKMAYDVRKGNPENIVISITGSDLLSYGEFDSTDHLVLQNEWKKALSARINFELGNRIGFAWTDDQMALVEASEISGYRGKNFVGSLIARIRSKHFPIEVTSGAEKDAGALLSRYLSTHEDMKIWLFVDDIDSTFSADEVQKARVSSFFSACRSLTRDVDGLFVRASVRTDVWTTVRYNEDLDKCEQYTIDISWTRTDLEKIISKKILSYIERNHGGSSFKSCSVDNSRDRELLLSLVFMDRLRWANSRVPPFTPIRILGAKRPRWMSQLCRLSAEAAADREYKRVGIQEINNVLSDFGRLRVNDIYKEHSHQFSHLQKLVETFTRGKKRYRTGELLEKIEKGFVARIGEESVGHIDGEIYVRPLQIAHLLYRVGFILLREIPNPGSPPRFIDYDERPELLTDPSLDYAGYIWEVHPSYRGILSIR
ncbi:P-loop ATPase, Sll1717 family [Marinobacter sp. CA1]|uniref:P-loop ATPase, Sll1717 family n=1 Tax=Marinobacter sp. CA1 TaxID=2817656 RepID=UPI001D085FCF|nr:hypothetical protein [Marinobacter sp. CA1]UDL05726.1 hypothetical protein J2887_02855 [Marinobacter sp. CA1]